MKDHKSPEAVEARASQEDPIVMYLIVRESLNMSIGKTAAQCAHASQMLLLKRFKLEEMIAAQSGTFFIRPTNEKITIFDAWLDSSFRKVVLKADDKEWTKVKSEFEDHVVVVDVGLTEIPSNSETVIGLWPMRRSQRPKILQRLQTLK